MRVSKDHFWHDVEVGETWYIKDVVGPYVVEAAIVSCTDKVVLISIDGRESRREWTDIKFIEKLDDIK